MNKIARFMMISLSIVVGFSAVAFAEDPIITITSYSPSGTAVTVNYNIDFGYTFGDYNFYVDGRLIDGNTYAGSDNYSSTASALSAGSHTFTITAINPQGLSTTVSENYDAQGPNITITSYSPSGTVLAPANVTVNYDIDFRYTFGDYYFYVDGQLIDGSTYAGSESFSSTARALVPGNHTFTITAINPQGYSNTKSRNYTVGSSTMQYCYNLKICYGYREYLKAGESYFLYYNQTVKIFNKNKEYLDSRQTDGYGELTYFTNESEIYVTLGDNPRIKLMEWDDKNNIHHNGYEMAKRVAPSSGTELQTVQIFNEWTNIFHHVNRIYTYFASPPFNCTKMNFQMQIFLNDPNKTNNAEALNGNSIRFCPNGTFYSSTIYHEWVHNMVYNLNGDLSFGITQYATSAKLCGLDEGFAFYFACAVNDTWVYRFIDGTTVSLMTEDLSSHTLIPNKFDFSAEIGNNEIHGAGKALASACMDLRNSGIMEPQKVDEWIYDAITQEECSFSTNPVPNFIFNIDDFMFNMRRIGKDRYPSAVDKLKECFYEHHKVYVKPEDVRTDDSKTTITWAKMFDYSVTGNSKTHELHFLTPNESKEYTLSWDEDNSSKLFSVAISDITNPGNSITVYQKNGNEERTIYFYPYKESQSSGVSYLRFYLPTEPTSVNNVKIVKGLAKKNIYSAENVNQIPDNISLFPNYPNPFNPETTINYAIPKDGFVTLKLFDMLGREVARLVDGVKEAGSYQATFNGTGLTSGIYFALFTAMPTNGEKPFTQTMKMLLAK